MANGPRNIAKDKIHLNSFVGGETIDPKYGIPNSFYKSQAMDFRQKASQMSVLPGFRQVSGNLQDLITVIEQDQTGVRYAVGNAGNLYKIATTGVITNYGKLTSNGAAGLAYNQQSDQMYITGQTTVSMYGQLSNNPQLRIDQFGPSASTANGVIYTFDNATLSYDGQNTSVRNNLNSLTYTGITPSNYTSLVTNTLTNTYVLGSSINENSTYYCPFVPDMTPFYSVAVYVTTIGTGNWTLTMHDSLNNNLGAVTITNGNMKLGWNNFVFSTPINAIPNAIATGTSAAYHFHLTSSVSSDTAAVATINSFDLTGVNFVLFINRLITTKNGWHPATIFGTTLCIGNGPYLSTYNFSNDSAPNNSQWIRHQLALDYGYEVCGLAVNQQYLVIAAEKRSSNANKNFQSGMLYWWDGVNASYNFKTDISMGAPYSLKTINNVTYFICGGSLFAVSGAGSTPIKVRYIAYQNTDYLGTVDSTYVNPQMMDIRYNLLMIGYPSTTTNVNINYGVYSWGAVELSYPNSFGYSYVPSIDAVAGHNYSVANNMQIGMIRNFVDTMYLSWQYTDGGSVTHYGLDIVDNTSSPAPTFSWTSLIWDGGVRYKTKNGMRARFNFLSWPANCTLNVWYSADRGAAITADPVSGISYTAATGNTAITVELNNLRFHEIQFGFTGTTSGATTQPVFTGATIEVDALEDEVGMRNDLQG